MVSTHYRVELECRHYITYYEGYTLSKDMSEDDDTIYCKYCKAPREVEAVRAYEEIFD